MPLDSVPALDRALRSIRFVPRPSLEAEVLLRARKIRAEPDSRVRSLLPWLWLGLMLLLFGAGIFVFWVRLVTLV